MKKNDLVKIAVIALAAGFCISGQVAHTSNQELAMTKCSKTAKPANDDGMDHDGMKGNGNGKSNGNGNGSSSDDQSDTNTSKLDRKAKSSSTKNKSAARKVMEGIGPSNTSMNAPRKSAARKAMDAETN